MNIRIDTKNKQLVLSGVVNLLQLDEFMESFTMTDLVDKEWVVVSESDLLQDRDDFYSSPECEYTPPVGAQDISEISTRGTEETLEDVLKRIEEGIREQKSLPYWNPSPYHPYPTWIYNPESQPYCGVTGLGGTFSYSIHPNKLGGTN